MTHCSISTGRSVEESCDVTANFAAHCRTRTLDVPPCRTIYLDWSADHVRLLQLRHEVSGSQSRIVGAVPVDRRV